MPPLFSGPMDGGTVGAHSLTQDGVFVGEIRARETNKGASECEWVWTTDGRGIYQVTYKRAIDGRLHFASMKRLIA